MALHEKFSQYTKDEIRNIKISICKAHKCPYFASMSTCNMYNGKNVSVENKACNYILYTGKPRGCMPDECKHYLDEDVKKKRFGINITKGEEF